MFYYGSYRSINETNEAASDNSRLNRNFSSFDFLREGDIEPALGKMIHVLIENGGDSLIFAFTAGFSERMVPNMIYHFKEVNVKNSAPKTTMES